MDSTSNAPPSGPPGRKESSSSHSAESIEDALPRARQKRGPNSLTANACTNCKRAKAKCDGARPTCLRCRGRGQGAECSYEMHTKLQKEDMIREIRELREKNNWVERILRAIRTDDHGSEVIRRLQSGQSYETISKSMNRPAFADIPQLAPDSQLQLTKAIAEYELDLKGERNAGDLLPGSNWTNATTDEDLIDHLMALYFTWIHPAHMVFSENHFLASYKNRSDLYCTTGLVSVICAMACHLLDINPEDSAKWRDIDSIQLRERFMEEARNKVPHDNQPKMTTIQTFAIMFLVDLGSGQASRASHYIRNAGEMLNTRLKYHYSTESMQVTRWGIYSLNVAWASISFQMPTVLLPRISGSDVFKDVLMDTHTSLWRFSRHAGVASGSEHPSSAIMVARENAKLMLMVHKTTEMLYDQREELVSASEVIRQYKEYLEWEKELPQEISLSHGDPSTNEIDQLTPHVLSLYILYHTVQTQLIQPCLSLEDIEPGVRNHLTSIIVSHARKSYEGLQLYRELFSLRYHPTLQNFYLLQACDILVRYSPTEPPATSVVRNCLQFLKEAADGHGGFRVCGPLQGMFKQTAIECQIALPDDLDDLMGPDAYYTTQNLIDASTRLTYRQPLERIVANMNETISQDLDREWPAFEQELAAGPTRARANTNTSTRNMRIDELLNDTGDAMEL